MGWKLAEQRRQRIASEVARLLHEERQRANLSMTTVAERGGLSSQMVGYVERGIRMPTLDTLLRMTDALGVSLPELLRKAGAE